MWGAPRKMNKEKLSPDRRCEDGQVGGRNETKKIMQRCVWAMSPSHINCPFFKKNVPLTNLYVEKEKQTRKWRGGGEEKIKYLLYGHFFV